MLPGSRQIPEVSSLPSAYHLHLTDAFCLGCSSYFSLSTSYGQNCKKSVEALSLHSPGLQYSLPGYASLEGQRQTSLYMEVDLCSVFQDPVLLYFENHSFGDMQMVGRVQGSKGYQSVPLALAVHDILWTPLESAPRPATTLAQHSLCLGFATLASPGQQIQLLRSQALPNQGSQERYICHSWRVSAHSKATTFSSCKFRELWSHSWIERKAV